MRNQDKELIVQHVYDVLFGHKEGYIGMSYEQGLLDMIDIIDSTELDDIDNLNKLLEKFKNE